MIAACGGATRRASTPQAQTTVTAAEVSPRNERTERLVVAEPGSVAMVSRGGCVATVRTSEAEGATSDELRVRCPKPERLEAWFDSADRVVASLALEPLSEARGDGDGDDDEIALPTAKILTTSGKTLRVTKAEDVKRLSAELRALSAELASSEAVAPGPSSERGWQMLHVMGPAHVLFAGSPARGVLEARVSTTGQYFCEFVTDLGDGPIRATKSGWLTPKVASRAIDDVLVPFTEMAPDESARATYAAGTKGGAESRTSSSSTAAIFERFAQMQEALGDACLPELEPPALPPIGL